eukprot:TRINITY_DN669_c0_g2_i1.p1 TRINITY_DN669_c0_g2~~TRINITY_DN669_c0_g2_i1.p1  ORF type:complete len:1307 (+),score=431.10 TRINITY_DN669_c0_g2_i1:535-3921(+)
MAEMIVEQLMASKPGRRRQLLHWLRLRAESGSARLSGRIVLETDIDEAAKRFRKLASATRKPAAKRARAAPKEAAEAKDAAEESDSSSSSSGADSESSGESDSGESDLSAEEEVDREIEGSSGVVKDLMIDDLPAYDDGRYKNVWKHAPEPGCEGFSAFSANAMRAAGVATAPLKESFDASLACPPLQPHQEAAAFLLHPKSPVKRLLVDHPTGSGKTREMIEVLDAYFFDPRPKVPIFPKEPVCQNFYAELLRWPSKYRDFFCCMRPEMAARAAGLAPKSAVSEEGSKTAEPTADWRTRRSHRWELQGFAEDEMRQLCRELRIVLEMKGYFYMGRMRKSLRAAFVERFPGEHLPAGPLRALRYTSAGGGYTRLREEDGLPASALLKIGFDKNGGDKNVYSNKVVIMDEVHNLVRTQTMYGEQLARLRDLLYRAKGSVIAGFTGTPIVSEPQEGRQLLDILKGHQALMRGAGDEGFISSFHMRPAPLFPKSLPRGIPDSVLTPNIRRQLVKKVEMSGEPLQRYEVKRGKFYGDARLKAYCNMCVYFGSFHDGKTGQRQRILENFAKCAPKLHQIARDVVEDSTKVLVLIQRNTGMSAFLEHLQAQAAKSDPPFQVATMDNLAAFNAVDNLRGEKYRVMVADSLTCSEGVSFFGVRRVLLADVPANPCAFVQSVGRSIRMYGHRGLTEEEQTVTTTVYCSTFPQWLQSPLGVWAYRAQPQREDPVRTEKKAKRLIRSCMRAGIKDLETMKERLDAYVQREQSRRGAQPDASSAPAAVVDAVGFLESAGLWKEAKLVRTSQLATTQPHRLRRSKAQAPKPQGHAKVQKHYLVRALHWITTAGTTTEEVVKAFKLDKFTADEEAVSTLAERSRVIVPALEELRSKAADREVLASLAPSMAEEEAMSEGECSVCNFAVDSETDGDEDLDEPAPKKAALVLPAGWHVRRFERGTWKGREFVDPAGRVYRTEAQARKAVDAQRRAENMARTWAARLATLRARKEAAAAAEAEAAEAVRKEAETMKADDASPTASTTSGGESATVAAEACNFGLAEDGASSPSDETAAVSPADDVRAESGSLEGDSEAADIVEKAEAAVEAVAAAGASAEVEVRDSGVQDDEEASEPPAKCARVA